jgi:dTDP-4-dehydrorhamnose reductase
MKILILGSSGSLGRVIYAKLKKKHNTKHNGIIKRQYDLSKYGELKILLKKTRPDLILNCAAIVDIDYCEKFKKKSKIINFNLVERLFKIKKKNNLNFQLIQFSTDHVYDGKKGINNKESAKLFFNNEYAHQKYLSENICLKNKAIVFRTNFFGKSIKNFGFSDWLYKVFSSKEDKPIFLFDDVYFSPLRINTIADIMSKLILKKKNLKKFGTYNLCSKYGISKKVFALKFAKDCGLNKIKKKIIFKKVNNVLTVKRSKNMKMCWKKFQVTFNIKLNYLSNEIKDESKNYA